MTRPKVVPPLDLEGALPAMAEALKARGFLKKTDLRSFQVPPPLRDEVLGRLEREGFELTKTGVRVPLAAQLERLLQERKVLPWPLGKLLKGGTVAEGRAVVMDLARNGRLQLLVRGKAEALAHPDLPALSREEMRALGPLALSVRKALAGKPLPRTLLWEDVREVLGDLPAAARKVEQAPAVPAPLAARVVLEARRLMDPRSGLCFVPDLVLALLPEHALGTVHEALVQAVRDRRLELRPEAGMDRLGRVELGLCPPGAQGTRLSWARPLEPRP